MWERVQPWFEYHCWESEQSTDAQLWHRTHQRVTVLGTHDEDDAASIADRGGPMYRVRFADGFVGTVFPDELMRSRHGFYRPDYPA